MISLKNYDDLNDLFANISLIRCILFFLLIYLGIAGLSFIFNIDMNSLLFKFALYGLMLIFFIFALKVPFRQFKNSFIALKKSNMSFKVLFIVIANCLFTATIFFVLTYLSNVYNLNFNSFLFGFFDLTDYLGLIFYIFVVIILSPIVEEFLFRGIILRKLVTELHFDIKWAVLISSFLFGICHNFGGIISAFLFGICMAFLYIKSKNIFIPILAHLVNNLLSFILACSGVEIFLSNNLIIGVIIILAILTNFILFRDIFREFSKL